MSQQLFVKVPRAEAQLWRERLRAEGVLVSGLKTQREGDIVYFPVHDAEYIKKMKLGTTYREVERYQVPRDPEAVARVLPESLRPLMVRSHDRVGDILLLRLPEELAGYEAPLAKALMKAHKGVRTVALDERVTGPYRVRQLRVIGGAPDLTTEHREFGLRFRMDLGKAYFSPRLASERDRVVKAAQAARASPAETASAASTPEGKGENVVDMFAGVGPFAIGLARRADASKVIACDINPAAIADMKVNIRLNRAETVVEPRPGDVAETLTERDWADRVVLNHPTASLDFLELAVGAAKREAATLHLYLMADKTQLEDGTLKTDIQGRLAQLGRQGAEAACHIVHGYSTTMVMAAVWCSWG